ncbi:hypothetical protein ABFS83_12G151600 [Erythranthe nasuta]
MTAGTNHKSETMVPRALGNTEQNWCRAVSSGTGITVLALQMDKSPSPENSDLEKILDRVQKSHPLLRSKLHYNPTTKSFSFLAPTAPKIHLEFHDAPPLITNHSPDLSPLHSVLEHEMNSTNWSEPSSFPTDGAEVILATVYKAPPSDDVAAAAKSVVVLRFHTSVCDRTTAVALLRELMELVAEETTAAEDGVGGGGIGKVIKNEREGKTGIENMIPNGMAKKTIWGHGRDMLGYSVSSLRLTNLTFNNTKRPRVSQLVRLQITKHHTALLLAGCKFRGIKLCGALSAAALIAAHSTKLTSDHKLKKKYGVVTLIDCRSLLEPPLSVHHFGFYHSAILNTHTVNGTENFWDLAKACYTEFASYKQSNKHFSDMADLNFLMSKAMENPSLTPSSSLRTSLVTVFEEPVIDNSGEIRKKIGVDDYVGCASTHGVGPSIAMFDTVRDGELDCACVYPSPLHSREQMNDLVDRMKRILIDETC